MCLDSQGLRTRFKGWCPGDELALCLFTDSVLDGKVLPYVKSMRKPVEVEQPGVGPPEHAQTS